MVQIKEGKRKGPGGFSLLIGLSPHLQPIQAPPQAMALIYMRSKPAPDHTSPSRCDHASPLTCQIVLACRTLAKSSLQENPAHSRSP